MMGIPGLTSFLDINNHLLVDVHLRNTKVVIDGNNLFHFLYYLYGVCFDFGGDYDAFAGAVKSFFKTLTQCDITAIVVFDGPYDPKEKKVLTSIKRAAQRIEAAHDIFSGKGGKMSPILVQEVFISAINDLGIKHITCNSEADSAIAALANSYGCPVMTNDSDFFIFNIKGGTILLDYVNLNVRTEKSTCDKFVKVHMYYFDVFHKNFPGMHEDQMALFGTLMGNDKVERKAFEVFYSNVHLNKSGSENVQPGFRWGLMLGVLNWLQEMETLDASVEKILALHKREERKKLRDIIMDSVDTYRDINHSHYLTFVEQNQTLSGEDVDVLKTYAGHELPDWFMNDMRKGKVPLIILNALVSRQVILHAQPENTSRPSAHDSALPLRRLLYGIILQYDQLHHQTAEGFQEGSKCSCSPISVNKNLFIEEIDRALKNQKRTKIEPKLIIDEHIDIPRLSDIPHIDSVKRLEILCAALGVSPERITSWPKGLELYLGLLVYWVHHGDPHIDWLQLSTALLCVIKLAGLDHIIHDDSSTNHNGMESREGPNSDDGSTMLQDTNEKTDTLNLLNKSETLNETIQKHCDHQSMVSSKISLDKYCRPTKVNSSAQFINCGIHNLSQLQACILAVQALNYALGSPVPKIQVEHVFNGTFLFSVYRELKSRSEPEKCISEFLNDSPTLLGIFHQLKSFVVDCLKPKALVLNINLGIRSKRMKKKSKKTKNSAKNSSDEDLERESETESVGATKLVAKCDLRNKFDLLGLSDEN